MRRTIEFYLPHEFTEAVRTLNDKNVEAAVGYLAHWALFGGRFATAKIAGDKDGNLSALYLKDDGSLGYEIFGLRGEDGTYSFHS